MAKKAKYEVEEEKDELIKQIDYTTEQIIIEMGESLNEMADVWHKYHNDSLNRMYAGDYIGFSHLVDWMIETGREVQRLGLEAQRNGTLAVRAKLMGMK